MFREPLTYIAYRAILSYAAPRETSAWTLVEWDENSGAMSSKLARPRAGA